MTPAENNLYTLLSSVRTLVNQLIEENKKLKNDIDDLQDHIEGLNTKLTAAKAETLTLNQEDKPKQQTDPTAKRDTERLKRFQTLLKEYLSDINKRIAPQSYVNEQN